MLRARIRIWAAGFFAVFIVLVFFAGCGGSGGSASASTKCGSWNVSTTGATLVALAVRSPRDVWAVGLFSIQHWDGHGWSDVGYPAPQAVGYTGTAAFTGIAAVGPEDAWAAAHEQLEHWDGTRWTATNAAPFRQRGTNEYHLFSNGPDDAWVTWRHERNFLNGGDSVSFGGIEHWNGKAWARIRPPAVENTTPGDDFAYADTPWLVSSPDGAAWTAGDIVRGTIAGNLSATPATERWNGQRWRRVPLPRITYPYTLDSVAAPTRTDAWIAGERSSTTGNAAFDSIIVHWDGSRWTVTPTGFPSTGNFIEEIRDIAASPTRAWAVGAYRKSYNANDDGLLLSWNGKRWQRLNLSGLQGHVLLAVAADKSGEAWAVGDGIRAHFRPCRKRG
jgi:hypothetical protein